MSESFESVMAFALKTTSTECMNEDMREWCYSADGCQDCTAKLLNRLKRAHEHEIEYIRKASFHEGYVAGQRSMDAEHRAMAMRLRGLRFDGGSHENLDKVAYAIYPCATGWTCESCEGLRDKIIDLLGGVHECGADCGGCGAGCDCADSGGGQQEAVDVDDSVPDVRADVPTADGVADSSFTQVMYDVLDSERHKAVCELRKLTINSDYFGNYQRIARAIGTEYDGKSLASECVRDRLIHLLGGDEPTAMEYIQRIVREHDIKCLDMEPSGAELSQASVDAMSRRAKSCKGGETIKSVGECDGKIMESGENHQIEATITDELRECVNTATKTYDDTLWYEMGDDSEADHTICHITEGELTRIADRMDEQEHRLRKHRDGFERQHQKAVNRLGVLRRERDELQAKLEEADAAIANYREREKSFAESERLREELRRSLRQIAEQAGVPHERDLSDYSDEKIVNAVIGQLGKTKQYVESLEWVRDRRLPRIEAERDELKAKLDAIREAMDG